MESWNYFTSTKTFLVPGVTALTHSDTKLHLEFAKEFSLLPNFKNRPVALGSLIIFKIRKSEFKMLITLLLLFIIVSIESYNCLKTYRWENIQGRCFENQQLNILTFKNVVDGIDERRVDGRHDVGEQSRSVSLNENERGKAPNSSDKSKR